MARALLWIWLSMDQFVLRGNRQSQQGFTLIEMMVALAVFSLAALALLRLQGATVSSTAVIETRALGQIVANNLAVEALTDAVPPPLGKSEGVVENGGRKWRWSRITKRTADVRIVRIDIGVVDEFGRPGGALSLARTAQ
jgi:general secretion pathway protein I